MLTLSSQFILEFDEGKGGNFVECFNGRGKTYTLGKLLSGTHYRLRLSAVSQTLLMGDCLVNDFLPFV